MDSYSLSVLANSIAEFKPLNPLIVVLVSHTDRQFCRAGISHELRFCVKKPWKFQFLVLKNQEVIQNESPPPPGALDSKVSEFKDSGDLLQHLP